MQLKQITDQLQIWKDWRNNYKRYVPLFIEEAKTKANWKDWNQDVFWEYFARPNKQAVSSLQQGYFNKEEQKEIKDNWHRIGPLLKGIAEQQDTPNFALYEQLQQIILSLLDKRKLSAIRRLIAGLQPKLLTTVITQKYLNELYHLLRDAGIVLPEYNYDDWYRGSFQMLQYFKRELPDIDYYDLITYPWQTLEFLRDTDIETNTMDESTQEIIDLLIFKKQIILQGPPGTGKTRLAKILAEYLTTDQVRLVKTLTDQQIVDALKNVQVIYTAAGGKAYEVLRVDQETKNVTLKKSTENTGDTSFDLIRRHFSNQTWKETITDNETRRAAAIAKLIFEQQEQKEIAAGEQLVKLIQFHPSYSYEDFVRGLVASPSEDGKGILYEAKNKAIAEFAKAAYHNWQEVTNPVSANYDKWLRDTTDDFMEWIDDELEKDSKIIPLTNKVYISRTTSDSIRFNGDAWDIDGGVPVNDLVEMYKAGLKSLKEVKELNRLTKTAKHSSSYWFKILELFRKYLADNDLKPPKDGHQQSLKQYVLIIDEINRANLSAVFGELIYALEYRGEKVETVYAVANDPYLIIPDNLLVIGTMNTADRSIGHIDYAIRRRFAFVDVVPEIPDSVDFETDLFKKVSALFVEDMDVNKPSEHLSQEFRPKDVWIGQSYFIKKDGVDSKLRLRYEILPILDEYVRDGVLKTSAKLTEVLKGLKSLAE